MSSNPGSSEGTSTTGTQQSGDSSRGSDTKSDRPRTGRRGGDGHNGRNRRNRNGGSKLSSYLQNFKGKVEEIGAVLGTGSEQKDLKDRYQNLIDKLVSYILRSTTYPNARDIVPLLTDLADVHAALAAQLPPYPPTIMSTDGKTEIPPKQECLKGG